MVVGHITPPFFGEEMQAYQTTQDLLVAHDQRHRPETTFRFTDQSPVSPEIDFWKEYSQ